MTDTPKMITASELAKKHKIDPKKLRMLLRNAGMGARGARYEWKESDPALSLGGSQIKSITYLQNIARTEALLRSSKKPRFSAYQIEAHGTLRHTLSPARGSPAS